MNTDSTGHFPIFITLILCAGLIIGGAWGGIISYNNAVSAGKEGIDLFWTTLGGVALGGALGVAGAGLFMAATVAIYAGAAFVISGTVGVTIAGIAATKIVALGIAVYNIVAAIVTPLLGLSLEIVEWGGSSYMPPKPQKTPPRH